MGSGDNKTALLCIKNYNVNVNEKEKVNANANVTVPPGGRR